MPAYNTNQYSYAAGYLAIVSEMCAKGGQVITTVVEAFRLYSRFSITVGALVFSDKTRTVLSL